MGTLVIISSPSGGGKNSVINAVMEHIPNSTRLITTTSRAPRPGEEPGVDYYFVSRDEFEKKIEEHAFIEYNEYAGNLYGTQRGDLDTLLNTHTIVFSQIEVNGKHAFDRAKIPNISIFLVPEDFETLKGRIRIRGGVSEEKMNERIQIAEAEMRESEDYDYRVVNKEGKFEETVDQILKILERLNEG